MGVGAAANADAATDYAALLAPPHDDPSFLESIRDRRTYPYIERARRLIAGGDLTEAKHDLEIYLERAPHDLSARFTYGVLLASLGEPRASASAMSTVLETRPGFGPAHLYRAFARQKLGDDAGALADFEAADKSQQLSAHDRALALTSTVDLALRVGELSAARRAATEGAALAPEDPTWLDRLAVIAEKQGDDAAAVGYRERAVALDPTADRQRALAVAAERVGEADVAVTAARAAVTDDTAAGAAADVVETDLERLAVLEAKAGSHLDAARTLERAHEAGGAPELLVRAAREYDAGGDRAAARAMLRRVDASSDVSAETRVEALEALVAIDATEGRDQEQREALTRLIALQGPRWDTLQALGDLELRTGRPKKALSAYGRALRFRDDAATRLAMGYAFQKIGKPGLAAYEIDRSLSGRLDRTQRLSALRTLGFLYAEDRLYEQAATAWREADELAPDASLTVSLARAERLAGQPLAAAQTLGRVSPSALGNADRAIYWSERSALARARGDGEVAIGDARKALVLEPNAERHATLGVLLADAGEYGAARKELSEALAQGASYAQTGAALGHVEVDLDDRAAAISMFEKALLSDPDLLSLYEDLGYAYVWEARNRDAVARFEQAIDNAPLYPATTEEERQDNERRTLRLRREVTELDRWISLVGYTSICFGGSNCLIDQTALIEGASESQGGAELSVRPPWIGFRNGRIFEVISRVLYQQEVNSIEPIGSSLVATVGARYKPFRTQDLYLSVERIFGVGSDATDNTLLRGSYGLLHGYRPEPDRGSWAYATLYVDLAYTAEPPRNWFAYVEGRVGQTFAYDGRALVTPLLYLRNRNLVGDGPDFFDVDIGAGLSLRWLWNDDRHHDYRSSFELLPRVGYDAYNSDGRGWNIFLTGVMQF